jgi:hypothetical protein
VPPNIGIQPTASLAALASRRLMPLPLGDYGHHASNVVTEG